MIIFVVIFVTVFDHTFASCLIQSHNQSPGALQSARTPRARSPGRRGGGTCGTARPGWLRRGRARCLRATNQTMSVMHVMPIGASVESCTARYYKPSLRCRVCRMQAVGQFKISNAPSGSARHLRKVVCSCGTKGLRATPALLMRPPSVARMAALICEHAVHAIIAQRTHHIHSKGMGAAQRGQDGRLDLRARNACCEEWKREYVVSLFGSEPTGRPP